MAINDITGDRIVTKPVTQSYRNNYGKICWSKLHRPPVDYRESEYTCPDCKMTYFVGGLKK